MTKVDTVLQEVRKWVANKKPYDTATMCHLFTLYNSLSDSEKYELKKKAGNDWEHISEVSGWGAKYGAQCRATSGSASSSTSPASTQSVDWKVVGIGIGVLVLILLLLWFFVFRR